MTLRELSLTQKIINLYCAPSREDPNVQWLYINPISGPPLGEADFDEVDLFDQVTKEIQVWADANSFACLNTYRPILQRSFQGRHKERLYDTPPLWIQTPTE